VMASWSVVAVPIFDIASAISFIMGLKLMSRARASRRGSSLLALGFGLAAIGMVFEIVELEVGLVLFGLAIGVVGGWLIGKLSRIDSGPGIGPWLAGAGGIAAALVAVSAFLSQKAWPEPGFMALNGGQRGAALGLAAMAGAAALLLGLRAAVGASARGHGQSSVTALAAAASGLAAAMVGFALGDPLVVTVGGLVAAAGYALASMVASALGRRPLDVALGAARRSGGPDDYDEVQACGPEEAAMVLETAHAVVLVPGYGMAVAQAQHALAELGKLLAQRGTEVSYAIHPAAGLIPGHMNILLDEAQVPPGLLVEWQAANAALAKADVALVVGANDIVNPGAADDPGSAVFGMPFLDVGKAGTVLVVKRTLRPGATGAKNPLFERPNVNLVFGDAKQVLQAIGLELKAQTKAAA
jgi:H+-translocating NAD(P) transhydrogenase subunit beta